MPASPDLKGAEMDALVRYLEGKEEQPQASDEKAGQERYVFTGYKRFRDPEGYPAIAPPWGTLNAIDMKTGKYLWKIPLGEYPELVRLGCGTQGRSSTADRL